MKTPFHHLLHALLLRESRATWIPAAILVMCSAVAGWQAAHARTADSWAAGWMTTGIALIAAFAILHTVRSVADDARAGWLGPLRGFGQRGDHYAIAVIIACAVRAVATYTATAIAFCLTSFFAARTLTAPARIAVVTMPQQWLTLAALCAFAVLITLLVRDASWGTLLAFTLLIAPVVYIIAYTGQHHAMPSARMQTLLYLHAPPYAGTVDPSIYWRVPLYMAVVVPIAMWRAARTIGRVS